MLTAVMRSTGCTGALDHSGSMYLVLTEGYGGGAWELHRPCAEQQEASAEDRLYSNGETIVNAGQYIEQKVAIDL